MPVPHRNTVVAAADWIHREIGHQGGPLRLREAIRCLPGVRIAAIDDRLPRGVPAAIKAVPGGVRIVFSRRLSADRQRFAIAHEVGHALLHFGHLGLFQIASRRHDEDAAELQANLFAAELLAPFWAVSPIILGEPTELRWVGAVSAELEIPPWIARDRVRMLRAARAAIG